MDRLYVAQGTNGLIKVGVTKCIKRRLPALRQSFRIYGSELLKIECCEEIENARGAEYSLIFKCCEKFELYAGREWFVNAPFDEVFVFATEATEYRKRAPVFQPMTQQEHQARLEKQRLAAEVQVVWLQERRLEINARRELREKRRIEVAIRLAEKAGLTVVRPAIAGAS